MCYFRTEAKSYEAYNVYLWIDIFFKYQRGKDYKFFCKKDLFIYRH